MDAYDLAVAAILKRAQEQEGAPSYTELAARTSMGRASVERYLNGKREITVRHLRELCRELRLDVREVLDEAENASI